MVCFALFTIFVYCSFLLLLFLFFVLNRCFWTAIVLVKRKKLASILWRAFFARLYDEERELAREYIVFVLWIATSNFLSRVDFSMKLHIKSNYNRSASSLSLPPCFSTIFQTVCLYFGCVWIRDWAIKTVGTSKFIDFFSEIDWNDEASSTEYNFFFLYASRKTESRLHTVLLFNVSMFDANDLLFGNRHKCWCWFFPSLISVLSTTSTEKCCHLLQFYHCNNEPTNGIDNSFQQQCTIQSLMLYALCWCGFFSVIVVSFGSHCCCCVFQFFEKFMSWL